VLLHVPPALPDFEEDCRVAADDNDARHQKAKQHQELFWGAPVLPGINTKMSQYDFFTLQTNETQRNVVRAVCGSIIFHLSRKRFFQTLPMSNTIIGIFHSLGFNQGFQIGKKTHQGDFTKNPSHKTQNNHGTLSIR
jgi:hypothetical protein